MVVLKSYQFRFRPRWHSTRCYPLEDKSCWAEWLINTVPVSRYSDTQENSGLTYRGDLELCPENVRWEKCDFFSSKLCVFNYNFFKFTGKLFHAKLRDRLQKSATDEFAQSSCNCKVDMDAKSHEENSPLHKYLLKNYLNPVYNQVVHKPPSC